MQQDFVGLDLGTTSIQIALADKGIVLEKPTVAAVAERTGELVADGWEALAMVGRTPETITTILPLENGVITNHAITRALIERYMREALGSKNARPQVAVCVPATITGIERDAVVDAVMDAGASKVYLIDEPLAAAIGCGVDVVQPRGCMVVDIGGGSTDISVLSLGSTVLERGIAVAGNYLDNAIQERVRELFDILIGPRTAEQLKRTVAGCLEEESGRSALAKGRSIITGMPAQVAVTTEDLLPVVLDVAEQITAATRDVLESTLPELAADIYNVGILLTGGGSLLRGLPTYMERALHMPVLPAADPTHCVALGSLQSLYMQEKLRTGFSDETPRFVR